MKAAVSDYRITYRNGVFEINNQIDLCEFLNAQISEKKKKEVLREELSSKLIS